MANLNATVYNNPTINDKDIAFNTDNRQYAMTQETFPFGLRREDAWTLEVRFKILNNSGYNGIFGIRLTNGYYWSFSIVGNSKGLYYTLYDANNIYMSDINLCFIDYDTYYTLTAKFDGNKIDLYIDGILIKSQIITETSFYTNCKIYIGAGASSYSNNGLNYLNGNIQAFRFYNKALTEQEIESNVVKDQERFN